MQAHGEVPLDRETCLTSASRPVVMNFAGALDIQMA
jgi:hypothetical protein